MRKYLLPETGNFYKSNLHCHTVVSDGKLTPEQVKEEYMKMGYSIIAYTDHDVLIPHPELADENFLPLNSYEMEVGEGGGKSGRCCHMCFIALEPDNIKQVCWHRSKYTWGNAKEIYSKQVVFDENEPDYERVYTAECVSDMMRLGRENGFFVTYNHPAWSLETPVEFLGYENMNAMEIVNGSCVTAGYADYNAAAYDTMLMKGKRLYCIATDDNHDVHPIGSFRNDSFRGFTMIKADKLEYKTITDAMLEGNFYASEAPEIHELWYEDGKVHIKCSAAYRVNFNTFRRRALSVIAEEGKDIYEAEFSVFSEDVYFRLTVTDKNGKHACTNAYFVDSVI